jgi:hypothetical protein
MVAHAPPIRYRIHAHIISCGLRGATADEIQRTLGLSGDTVRPRLVELRAADRITTMGELRETGSGRKALVWIGVMP